MSIKIEDIDSCNKSVKVTIPQKSYQSKVNAYMNQVGKTLKMPGFRKGKIPKSILEKRLGPEAKREVLTQLISETLLNALEENGIKAAGSPNLVEVNGEDGTDIEVSATVEVFPEFTLKDYSGIEVDMKINKVTDKEIDQVLEFYRNRSARSATITDRPVQENDFAKIDFNGTLDGKPFEGGSAQDHVLQIGQKRFLEGFEEHLIGMQIGESKEFSVCIADNYPKQEIAGKEVQFYVTLKGAQERELPELNDEFAKVADPDEAFENLEDMKTKVRERMEEEERKTAAKSAKTQLAEKLTVLNPISVPENLVKEQVRFMVQQERQKQAGERSASMNPDPNVEVTLEDEQKHRESAVKILQQELIVGKLAEDFGIKINEQDIDRELASFAPLLGGQSPEKLKKNFQKDGTLDRLRVRMVRDRALEQILESVTIKEVMVDREKGMADN